jgi:hypothetical protein
VRAKLATLLVVLLLPGTTAAGDDGLRIVARPGYGVTDGSVRDRTGEPADAIGLEMDPGHGRIRPYDFYLRLESALPLVPHAMDGMTRADNGTRGRFSRTLDSGSRFILGEAVGSHPQNRQSDIIFCYSIADTTAGAGIGIDTRDRDTGMAVAGSGTGTETVHVSRRITLPYAGIGIDLPPSGLSVGAEGSFMGQWERRLYNSAQHASRTPSRLPATDPGYRHPKPGIDDFDAGYPALEFSATDAGASASY